MKRCAVVSLACVISGAFAGSPAFAQTTTWNFNIFGPPRAVTAGIEAVRDFYKKESGGKFDIKIAYGSALGPERQAPEAIKAGGYEGAQLCAGYYPNKFPLLSAMELPFLAPRDVRQNARVYDAVMEYPEIVKEMADRWHMKYFAPTFLPAYEFMGNKKIASVADMKGVKMRISGLNAKVLQKFGAVPTMVTAPESYQALERGTIDSFGFPYSYTFGAYKLYEVSKYVTDGMAMSGFLCWQGVSLDAWNKLPADLKAKLPQAQKLALEALLAAYKKEDEHWIPVFKQKLEVDEFPETERDKLVDASGSIWKDWAKQQDEAGRPGTKLLEKIKAEVAKVKADAKK